MDPTPPTDGRPPVFQAEIVALGSRAAKEADHGRRDFLDGLTAHERELAWPLLLEMAKGRGTSWRHLWELDYKRKPPTPEEFLEDPYYLGDRGGIRSREYPASNGGKRVGGIYDIWWNDLLHVLDPKNEIFEWVLTGGLGTGKSSTGELAQFYKLIRLGCLRDPCQFYGLQSGTQITFMFFSLSKLKAETAFHFQSILDLSPFCLDNFPTKRRKHYVGDGEVIMRQVRMPDGIHFEYGATLAHALSLNVLSGILDEANFRGKKTIDEAEDVNSARALYTQATARITSRFVNKESMPGMLCMVSSKRTTADFVERHIKEVMANEQLAPHVFVSDYKLWDTKPEQFGHDRVFVSIGKQRSSSAVINRTSEEDAKFRPLLERARTEGLSDDRYLPSDVISVPTELEGYFRLDVEQALQDYAGVSTAPTGKLFDPVALLRGRQMDREHPFSAETLYIGTRTPVPISESFRLDYMTSHDGMTRRPKMYPEATRFIHVDLAKGRRDSCGLAMVCVSRVVQLKRYGREPDGSLSATPLEMLVPAPEIFVDFALRIRAIKDDEIDFGAIREFILWLRDECNYPIGLVTYDQYQSTDSMQMLQKAGLNTLPQSVDRTDGPYLMLREATYEDRFRCYDYRPYYDEARQLDWDSFKREVDHPDVTEEGYRGSKDVSDAVCGANIRAHIALTEKAIKGKIAGPRVSPITAAVVGPGPGGPSLAPPFPSPMDSWVIEGKQEIHAPEITGIGPRRQ